MTDRDVPWKVWVMIMLTAAIITSPLLVRVLEKAKWIERDNPSAQPVPLNITVEANARAEVPAQPGPVTSLRPPVPTPAPSPPEYKRSPAPPSPADRSITSQLYLTVADLDGYSDWELDVLRNEIYARHGRRFRRPELQNYFNGQPWYTPRYALDAFPEGILSSVERHNVELIAEYQRSH